ncbi:MAG: ABC transporter ATP-binding protein [Synechococcales cyanobacterium]
MHLETHKLTKFFATRQGSLLALDAIDLYINTGELVCIVGASGSGKTTLLRIIAGLDSPSSGQVMVDGSPVSGPGADRGMVFQSYTLYPWLRVADNVGFGLQLQGIPKLQRQERVAHYLEVVGLTSCAHLFPHQLSGGMKQRVAIARALATEPKVLLMDEPFGALDAQTKEAMHAFLLDVWQRTGTTILMITHDVEEAVFLSQRIYVLTSSPGRVKQEVRVLLPEERDYRCKRSLSFLQLREEVLDLLREERQKSPALA